MSPCLHTAIYTDNASRKTALAQRLLSDDPPQELNFLKGRQGRWFSNARIAEFLEEEARHETSALTPYAGRPLRTLSSGERKKALLAYLLSGKPEYLILDDPFDNLDQGYQQALYNLLAEQENSVCFIQLISRAEDRLPCIRQGAFLDGLALVGFPGYEPEVHGKQRFTGTVPPPPRSWPELPDPLVSLQEVTLTYGQTPVLDQITWEIRKGDFWELRGPNGSGKSSLITMISGDNPKAFGQNMYLFGKRKGSGESVWDIKSLLGYFTPAMSDRFRGYHTLENMLISGLTDSIGLYVQPTDAQQLLAQQWLKFLGMETRGQERFSDLTEGDKRLIFCARAMIKHPPLLILDEPTAGLDTRAARGVAALIAKMASQSETAIVFVSHRKEPGLLPEQVLELQPGPLGSKAIVV
ncbi:ATP-binding cassette domain-containing protein [Robiginitalea sp. M366]|uniref:ATP-binding cassette domain-containing protein n=1 Tax=Robiginitalea aestuariiviva TaxID=3036903 RepID=UPI00240DEB0C|nr:ATP-binding cassette domain-containing protein [Robiginitalea aestuariiviva]MDG1572213.1 ATP-binding cassette domain-containing protein [Robiginitalea aestuariiviva]